MSSFASSEWEALPPRRVMARKDTSNVKPKRVQVAGHQQILDNIEARKKISNNQSTLDSKDGCAGEFYEYLDHTADVQCHAWGDTMKEAFEHMAPCMFNYMTDISLVQIDPDETVSIAVSGHDLESLLFNFMSEMLCKFSTDCFVTVQADITHFIQQEEGIWKLTATLYGDIYNPTVHSSGTEIKAITYSNMQIHDHTNATTTACKRTFQSAMVPSSTSTGTGTSTSTTGESLEAGAAATGIAAPTATTVKIDAPESQSGEPVASKGEGRVDLFVIVDI
mmetsp:Transcript_18840/g.31534  ORF Transcript_18840/g.31534 Transcript_18840/m.31534 type:complete len:279 (-) Transcript_18840:271-1107(-)